MPVAGDRADRASITRNHYLHEFFPHTLAYASCDDEVSHPLPARMVSQQAPRKQRLADELHKAAVPGPSVAIPVPVPSPALTAPKQRRPSISDPAVAKLLRYKPAASTSTLPVDPTAPLEPVYVQCQVRTRIPTPHGHIFLHLYKNNRDQKEHLAFVADSAQMNAHPGEVGPSSLPFIRSESLDDEWREGETEIERIVRGAYVGRLSAAESNPSAPSHRVRAAEEELEPPLVRIHSECFTGEVIGSQRCDCGEQLDEAFRLITEAGRGVVVYLRQEGRGIGLLEKMRAYNLQDLGHDTVAANLLLGHGADLRTYDIAGAILRDLAIPEVRLLTNNPDKIEQIEKEGVVVVERVAMVPRSWTVPGNTTKSKKKRRPTLSGAALLALAAETSPVPTPLDDDEEEDEDDDDNQSSDSDTAHFLRRSGVGMIGGSVTRSAELDKYLKTKIERMGHLLALPYEPTTPPSSISHTPARRHSKSHLDQAALASSVSSLQSQPL